MTASRLIVSVTILALLSGVGVAQPGFSLVRVQAEDYEELYDHVPFKGTTIDIAGAEPGKSYELTVHRSELGLVTGCGLETEVLVDDLGTLRGEHELDAYYCSYDSMVNIMRNWAMTHPTLCMLDSIGQTYLGRWIYAVKISDNVTVDEDEPEILHEALHHSREWATPQAARHFCDTLLSNYYTNSSFKDFVDEHEIWVIPSINIDGYDYDYPQQRMWRLNRKPFGGRTGCDPNRNYPGGVDTCRFNQWGALVRGSRSTHYPGDETFVGPSGLWADCDYRIAAFFRQHTFVAHISMHSYSELVLWPYATGITAPDDAMLSGLGQGMASRMSRLSGGTYTPAQANDLYPTAGAATDWTYGWAHNVGGFPCMAYVFELGTSFYQNLSQVDAIEREAFDGAFYLFTHADSIIETLEGEVPPPVLAEMDSSSSGNYTIHWTPVRPEQNHPTKWELEELSGLSVSTDDFESGSGLWDLSGFSRSSSRAHSGSYSMFSGMTNNMSNGMTTKDPYPVQPGDSLTFWLWYDLETNYDVFTTEVSENGLEWFQLHDRYEGNSSGWQREAFSLEPWVGRSVYFRMRVCSDDNTLRTGAYVDDVHPVPLFVNHTVLSDNITDTLYNITSQPTGQYWYRVRGYNTTWDWNMQGPLEDIVVTGTGIAEGPTPEPLRTSLSAVRTISPGPFELSYTLARAGEADLAVTDASGRTVRTLVSGMAEPGVFSARWDGRDASGRRLAAGVYFCRLDADETVTARLVLTD